MSPTVVKEWKSKLTITQRTGDRSIFFILKVCNVNFHINIKNHDFHDIVVYNLDQLKASHTGEMHVCFERGIVSQEMHKIIEGRGAMIIHIMLYNYNIVYVIIAKKVLYIRYYKLKLLN